MQTARTGRRHRRCRDATRDCQTCSIRRSPLVERVDLNQASSAASARYVLLQFDASSGQLVAPSPIESGRARELVVAAVADGAESGKCV